MLRQKPAAGQRSDESDFRAAIEGHFPPRSLYHSVMRLFAPYSTVTDFARFRGWSTSVPMNTAV
jgi:hypothetical protein